MRLCKKTNRLLDKGFFLAVFMIDILMIGSASAFETHAHITSIVAVENGAVRIEFDKDTQCGNKSHALLFSCLRPIPVQSSKLTIKADKSPDCLTQEQFVKAQTALTQAQIDQQVCMEAKKIMIELLMEAMKSKLTVAIRTSNAKNECQLLGVGLASQYGAASPLKK